MHSSVFRLWAIEHLSIWPNRLHVLLALAVPIIVVAESIVGHFFWQPAVLAVGLVASLFARVWLWDRQRSDASSNPVPS